MEYRPLAVTLPDWEGPLDLLLHVIRTHKLDILNIPIAFVAEQYLNYLDTMRQLNLDVAAEYLEMAATLAHIKSRMMLPDPPEEEEEAEDSELDPRGELVRRLLEYQRYKDAAQRLAGTPQLGRDTFISMNIPDFPEENQGPPLIELGLFDLAEAFRRILERTKVNFVHEVTVEKITISERISEISEILRVGSLTPFDELFQGEASRFDLVITLLALLEMTKLRMTRIFQASAEGPIYVTLSGSQPATLDGSENVTGSSQPVGQPWQSKTTQRRVRKMLPRTIRILRSRSKARRHPRVAQTTINRLRTQKNKLHRSQKQRLRSPRR